MHKLSQPAVEHIGNFVVRLPRITQRRTSSGGYFISSSGKITPGGYLISSGGINYFVIRHKQADSGPAPSQWETSLQNNAVSHWLGAILESTLFYMFNPHHWNGNVFRFTQPIIQAQIKENIKAPCHWPLCREFTGDRWIPRTKGQ